MLKLYKWKEYKFRLVVWLITISCIGILVVGSAQKDLQSKHIFGFVMSLIIMVIVSLFDYNWVLKFHWVLYLGNIVMLLAVRYFLGYEAGGAVRWISIGGFSFQPSELSKIILILFFARYFMKHAEDLNKVKTLAKAAILLGIPLYLILRQPDLSTTIAVALVFIVMIYIAGLSYKIIGGMIVIAVPPVIYFFNRILQPNQSFLEGYQVIRILAWLRPEDYPQYAYQQTNSIIAIASGQLAGKGLDNNMISSVKNGNFISQAQTDFIFAVIGEELGFIGACAVIILLLLIGIECIWIGRKAQNTAGVLICSGVGALVLAQSIINICVAVGLLPNTGIPLPFLSNGLSSMVSLFIGMGLVLNVGLQSRKY